MADPSPPTPSPNDRRAFFRRLLLRGLDKVEEVTDGIGRRFNHFVDESIEQSSPRVDPRPAPPGSTSASAPQPPRYLRPPGALPEARFADTCSRCGKCVEACPAQCIRLTDDVAGGLPHIVARTAPCVVCTDLSCMKVCPSGALQLVAAVADIHMGLAVVDPFRCLRHPLHPGGGEDCRVCVTTCPLGDRAIAVDDRGRIEVRSGCIGCGVCERSCPTEPASIVVETDV